jgi:hypothetical protein
VLEGDDGRMMAEKVWPSPNREREREKKRGKGSLSCLRSVFLFSSGQTQFLIFVSTHITPVQARFIRILVVQ